MTGLLSIYERTPAIRLASNGQDQFGDPLARTETAIAGRFVQKTKLMRDAEGNETVATHLFTTTADISTSDKIRIGGVDYQVVNAEEIKDFTHRGWKVWLR
jgi:hypothetical protein